MTIIMIFAPLLAGMVSAGIAGDAVKTKNFTAAFAWGWVSVLMLILAAAQLLSAAAGQWAMPVLIMQEASLQAMEKAA